MSLVTCQNGLKFSLFLSLSVCCVAVVIHLLPTVRVLPMAGINKNKFHQLGCNLREAHSQVKRIYFDFQKTSTFQHTPAFGNTMLAEVIYS
jgi:hypothetical protein